MTNSRVISIVPSLPPHSGGVGDYAFLLAKQMLQDWGIETFFVVANASTRDIESLDGFPVVELRENSSQALTHVLGELQQHFSSTVLVQLSGYGYAKWSLYGWLVDGLRDWKQQNPESVLCTMFHELTNSSWLPWQHSFWVYWPQKILIRRMVQLSDLYLTNCHVHQAKLLKIHQGMGRPHQDIPLLPVFSNIGEPQQVPPLAQRRRQLVIFGQRTSRLNVYKDCVKEITAFCQQFAIENIIDIGSPTGLHLSDLFDVPVQQLGRLSDEAVSEILLNSMAAWSGYPDGFLEKSSVFAAYCSHGLVPVLKREVSQAAQGGANVPPFLASHDFSHSAVSELSIDRLQNIATQAYDWYQEHALSSQSKTFAEALL